jgi:hypothetical protein
MSPSNRAANCENTKVKSQAGNSGKVEFRAHQASDYATSTIGLRREGKKLS